MTPRHGLKISKTRTLLLLPLLIVLSGCVRLNMDLTINKDSTVSGTLIFALSDALIDLVPGKSSDSLGVGNLVDAKTKGVSVVPYKDSGFSGQKYILDHVTFNTLKSGDTRTGNFSIRKDGNQVNVSGFLDLTMKDQETTDPFAGLSAGLAKTFFAGADLRISITVPGKIVKSTGEISQDKRTVTWRPKIGEKTNLSTTIELPSFPTALVATGAGILVALVVAASLIGSRRRRDNQLTASVDSAVEDIVRLEE